MALLPSSLLALRNHPNITKIPPYLSLSCIIIGVIWLILLPLDSYSRSTYISENALLPGQVRTYFGGSEHNIFRAYRHEVDSLKHKNHTAIAEKLESLLLSSDLKAARQKYQYKLNDRNITGENVYAILQGPRADATEAIVLIAAWKNMEGLTNQSGVALLLSLARYFKQWSLWSKDIIFLICSDSVAGAHAWVDAYHNAHPPETVEALSIKSGALQGAIAVDYPVGPRGHRFEKVHIVYEGVNGQLPNLDLINTITSIAGTQLGIGIALQQMWKHEDTYRDRLLTVLRGMLNQGMGHNSGPHSAFIPYHVDAVTLQTVGDGRHDEMALGKMIESLFRSLNNLLEHFHQSFFFYLLMQTNRFVSIGTYLPGAMLIAMNFTISSIARWIESGRLEKDQSMNNENSPNKGSVAIEKGETVMSRNKGAVTIIPTKILTIAERQLLIPILFVIIVHLSGLLPLYTFMSTSERSLNTVFFLSTIINFLISQALAFWLSRNLEMDNQILTLIQCSSLLLLGMFLSALATLNFSLSFIVGLVNIPLSFFRPRDGSLKTSVCNSFILGLLSPNIILYAIGFGYRRSVANMLLNAAVEWHIAGAWTQAVVWLVWWPAWFTTAVVVASPIYKRQKT